MKRERERESEESKEKDTHSTQYTVKGERKEQRAESVCHFYFCLVTRRATWALGQERNERKKRKQRGKARDEAKLRATSDCSVSP